MSATSRPTAGSKQQASRCCASRAASSAAAAAGRGACRARSCATGTSPTEQLAEPKVAGRRNTGMTRLVLRVIAAACLGISSYVHLHLAHRYGYPGTISGETIFRIQGIVAATIGVLLL